MNIIMFFLLFIGIGLPIYLFLLNEKYNWQKMIGDSFFMGVFIVIVFLNTVQYFKFNLNIPMTFMLFSVFSLLSYSAFILINRKKMTIAVFNTSKFEIKKNAFYYLIFLIIVVHLFHIIVQNTSMPLIGWDAWNGWVAKAKIWHYHGISEPLINRFSWLQSESVLTSPIVHYPDGLSLLYLFGSGFLGWNETELNSMYPAMFIALLFSFFGNIKILTHRQIYPWIAVAMLVTIPLINIHLVLAGYADIWIAGYLILSIFNAQMFLNKPHVKSFISMAVFCIALVLFKLESWIWLSLFASTLLLSVISAKKRLILFALFMYATLIWFLKGGLYLELSFGNLVINPYLIEIPFLGSYQLTFLNTSSSLIEAMFFSKSWGLLWYLIPVVLILPFKIKDKSAIILPSIYLIFTLFFLFVLFYMTYASYFANDFTSSNRLVMHIVPLFIYLFIQVVSQYQLQKNNK